MKKVFTKISHGMVESIVADEEMEVHFLSAEGGHEDELVHLTEGSYYLSSYAAIVNQPEVRRLENEIKLED